MSTQKIRGRFTICDVFRITGRGLVLVGILTDGNFAIGDRIEFIYEATSHSYTIAGMEMFRRSEDWQKERRAILITCADEAEEMKLKELLKGEIPAIIYAADASVD